jgi:hypothetical protein
MHKKVVEDFFEHVLQWQMVHGPERAFRFKGIKASNGSVAPAHYPKKLVSSSCARHLAVSAGHLNGPGNANANAKSEGGQNDKQNQPKIQ